MLYKIRKIKTRTSQRYPRLQAGAEKNLISCISDGCYVKVADKVQKMVSERAGDAGYNVSA